MSRWQLRKHTFRTLPEKKTSYSSNNFKKSLAHRPSVAPQLRIPAAPDINKSSAYD